MKKGVKVLDLLLAVVIPTSALSKTPQNVKQTMASTAFASSSAATRGILGQHRNPQVRGVENRWGDTAALLAGLRLGATGTSPPAGAGQQRQVTQGARVAAPGGVLQLHSSAGRDTGSRLKPLNKAIHEDAGVCARKAWHSRRGLLPKDVKSLEAAQHLMQQGIDFEAEFIADRYADRPSVTITVEGADGALERSAAVTRDEMSRIEESDQVGTAVLQATLMEGGVVARADALEYAGGKEWDVFEVKSCAKTNFNAYLPDLAFTCSAARRSGINVRRAVMVTVETAPDIEDMFAEVDCTEQMLSDEGLIPVLEGGVGDKGSLEFALRATGGDVVPEAHPMVHCKKCALFAECVGQGLKHPIWELPRLGEKKFGVLSRQSLEISGISEDGLTATQQKHYRAVQKGSWVVADKSLAKDLAKMRRPYYYLDFESCSAIRPIFKGLRPFEVVITQYSLHSCESLDGELNHTDYLARGGSDFRRELLERLVKDLGNSDGSIVIYSPYEKTQLNAMTKLYPDIAGDVAAIVHRLVDFEQVIKSHVAHPEFRGRSSLKVTLPALVPEYSGKYEGMAVRDGQQASARFFSLAKGGLDAEEEERMRQELLDYCELDTLAMVELHRALVKLSQPKPHQ